jgi:hypothetical protein
VLNQQLNPRLLKDGGSPSTVKVCTVVQDLTARAEGSVWTAVTLMMQGLCFGLMRVAYVPNAYLSFFHGAANKHQKG